MACAVADDSIAIPLSGQTFASSWEFLRGSRCLSACLHDARETVGSLCYKDHSPPPSVEAFFLGGGGGEHKLSFLKIR